MAKNFKSEFNFPGRLYVDQARKIYKLLNLRRGTHRISFASPLTMLWLH
jgi:hypothetical protein